MIEAYTIRLTNCNEVVLLDEADYLEYKMYYWSKGSGGYAVKAFRVGSNRWRPKALHKFLMGDLGIVDHINGDRLDNRRANLRVTNRTGNNRNTGKKKNGTSSFKGVGRYRGRWRARIMVNRKEIHLGAFLNEQQAALAYNKAAMMYFGEFARVNVLVSNGDA